MTDANQGPQYCTKKQLANDPNLPFTEAMLSYYILHAHKNGLAPAIRRIGRKVLIRRDLLVAWIESQSQR